MEKTDEELIASYIAGDETAFAPLVQRHLKGVYSFAARLAGDEAEDIAQDTFMKAWKNIRNYDLREARFKTWLMRIARNTTIDYLRKKKPLVFSSLENERVDAFISNTPDPEPLPDELIVHAEDAREVHEVLEKLSPLLREVVLLRHTSHMTFEEMGNVLETPLHTVKSRYHRGLARLRQLLEAMHQKNV